MRVLADPIPEEAEKCPGCRVAWVHDGGLCSTCSTCPTTSALREAWDRLMPTLRSCVSDTTWHIWHSTVHLHHASRAEKRVVLAAHPDMLPWVSGRWRRMYEHVLGLQGIQQIDWEPCHALKEVGR